MSNKLNSLPSKEQQDASFDVWEAQFDTPLPTGEAALDAARARNETQRTNPETNERAADEPTQIVATQVDRIADMSDFVPYANLSEKEAGQAFDQFIRNGQTSTTTEASPSDIPTREVASDEPAVKSEYTSRVARSANTISEKLSSFAETYDKEGAKGLARRALGRIGRAVTSPARNTASAFLESIKEEVDENDDHETYKKDSARVIDWTAEKVMSNGDSKVRASVANKLYDKAYSVDERKGTYASRAGDKIRSGIDKMDAKSRENDGWLRDKIADKYKDAKERRKNRIKKQHIRTLGRKIVAYHTAGREASKNLNKKESLPPKEVTQNDFKLVR